MKRNEQREKAFCLIFEASFFDNNIEEVIIKNAENEEIELSDYIINTAKAVYENSEKIDQMILKYAKGWKLNRISKVTLSILRLAVYEAFLSDDAPENVAINEAIELAKKYDTDEAPAFVNGILGSISRQYK